MAVTVGFLLVRVSPGPELIFRPIADPGLTLTPARPLGSWPRYDYGVGDPTVLLTASIDVAYWKWLHTRLLSPVLSVPLAATGVVAAVAELLVRRR